jgi:predicted metal-dependent hydrolase
MEAQNDPRLLKGIDEFNQGLFFECHETLEEIWLEDHGDDRKFYQGIIQIAAGYFKWEQGVPVGAIKLWRSGLEKMAGYGPVHLGVNVGAFVEAVGENLRQLETVQPSEIDRLRIDAPVLQLVC